MQIVARAIKNLVVNNAGYPLLRALRAIGDVPTECWLITRSVSPQPAMGVWFDMGLNGDLSIGGPFLTEAPINPLYLQLVVSYQNQS